MLLKFGSFVSSGTRTMISPLWKGSKLSVFNEKPRGQFNCIFQKDLPAYFERVTGRKGERMAERTFHLLPYTPSGSNGQG